MSPYRAAPSADVRSPRRHRPFILRLAALNSRRRLRSPSIWNRDAAHVLVWAGFFALPIHGLPAFEPFWLRWLAALALGVLMTLGADAELGWRQVERMQATMRKMRGTHPCHVCGAGPFEDCDAGLHS